MKKIFSLLLGACTIFTACTDEDEPLSVDSGKCLQINVGVNQTAARSIITGTALPDESQVGVSLIDESGSVYSQKNYNNVCFTGSSEEGVQKWTPLKNILLNETKGTLYAYWPYAEGTDLNAINIETTSQTDYLYGTPVPDISEKNSTANVTMNHAMSNIRLTFKDSGYQGSGILQSVSVYGKGIATTARFNAISGTYNSTGDAETPVIDATEKNLKDAVSNLMVIPNGVEDVINIELVVDGQTFITKSTLLTLAQGKSYNFEVQVKNTHAEISSFSVNPWVDTDFEDPLVAEKIDEFKDAILLTYFVDESSISSPEDGVNVSLIHNTKLGGDVLGKISGMRIDGNVVTPVKTYNFNTPGYHTVEILMKDKKIIPENMFYNCPNLKSVRFTKDVDEIREGTFYGCSGLTNLSIDPENSKFHIPEGSNAIVETATSTLVRGCNTTVIPETVVKIGSNAFYGCTNLENLVMPNSVTTIGEAAFAAAKNYNTQLWQAQGLEIIENDAFLSCIHVNIILADNIKKVGAGAFRAGKDIYIELGEKIEEISFTGYNSWGTTDKLTVKLRGSECPIGWLSEEYLGGGEEVTLIVPDGSFKNFEHINSFGIIKEVNSIVENQFIYTADKKTLIKSPFYCNSAVVIPEGVEVIFHRAFNGRTSLNYIQLPSTLIKIGDYAFEGCTALMGEFTIPNSVKSIGKKTFAGCNAITSFDLGNGVQTIKYGAFQNCKGITEINIPNSVNSIGEYAFAYCSELTSLELGTGVQTIGRYAFKDCNKLSGELIIPNSVTSIEEYAFNGCTGFNSLNLGNGVQTIGESAFEDCTGLTGQLIIPNSVTSIGYESFRNNKGLTSLDLGTGLKTIDRQAFLGCENIASIVSRALLAPAISDVFYAIKKEGTLTVPLGKKETYAYWMQDKDGYLGYYDWTIQEMTE